MKVDFITFLLDKYDDNDYAIVVFATDNDGLPKILMYMSDGSIIHNPCVTCSEKHPDINVCGCDIWCYPHKMSRVMHDRDIYKKLIANTPYAEGADKFFAVYDAFEEY